MLSLRPAPVQRAPGWLTALLVAAVAASTLLGVALAAPAAVAGQAPLPPCRYDDILTTPGSYAAWSTTLVDTILRVTEGYVPPDLVAVSKAGIGGSGKVRSLAIDDLRAMTAAAKAARVPIAVQSAYRSYATQESTFQGWVNQSGYQQALLYSARPGHSEHQLGLAVDFRSAGGGPPWKGTDWGKSPAGKWMAQHAWQYGWVLSYPNGKESKTCYAYEPWHYRYVGRDLARAIHASGLTVREYLWAHFTTAAVSAAGSPGPSASAPASSTPSTGASPSSYPSEVPTGSPEPSLAPSPSPSAAPTESPPEASASPDPAAAPGTTVDPAPVAEVIGLALGILAVPTVLLLLWGRRRRPGT